MSGIRVTSDKSQDGERLVSALRSGRRDEVLELLTRPVDVNYISGPTRSSPLMIAAYRGYADVCSKLLELGANVLYEVQKWDDRDEDENALTRAKASQDAATLEVIKKAEVRAIWNRTKNLSPVDPEDIRVVGAYVLMESISLGVIDLSLEILGHGGVPVEGPAYYDQEFPLVAAANGGYLSLCAVLVALGANPADLRNHPRLAAPLQSAFEVMSLQLFGPQALNRPPEWDIWVHEKGSQISFRAQCRAIYPMRKVIDWVWNVDEKGNQVALERAD